MSCSQTISIHGKPNTTIYSSDKKVIATVPNSGIAKISLSKKTPYHLLLSQEENSDTFIPLGLDFGLNKTKVTKAALVGIGTYSFCIGVLALYAENWPLMGVMMPLGIFTTIVGCSIGQGNLSSQAANNYKYLPEQQTNQDIVFTPLKQTAEYKTLDKTPKQNSQVKKSTERRKFNSGGSQSNKDQMSVITGTYSGKGELLDGSDVIEEYTDLSIVIKKKSENTVSVEVLASDGYSYFDEEMIYSVNRQDNQYVLKQKGSNSRIVIKNGNLSYTNHNINDGETVFTLKITADK